MTFFVSTKDAVFLADLILDHLFYVGNTNAPLCGACALYTSAGPFQHKVAKIEPEASSRLTVWVTRYVNGRQYASAENSCVNPAGGWFTSAVPPTACGPPFDQPFRILLNVAVGGLLPGRAPSKDTVFPQTMLVRAKPPPM